MIDGMIDGMMISSLKGKKIAIPHGAYRQAHAHHLPAFLPLSSPFWHFLQPEAEILSEKSHTSKYQIIYIAFFILSYYLLYYFTLLIMVIIYSKNIYIILYLYL